MRTERKIGGQIKCLEENPGLESGNKHKSQSRQIRNHQNFKVMDSWTCNYRKCWKILKRMKPHIGAQQFDSHLCCKLTTVSGSQVCWKYKNAAYQCRQLHCKCWSPVRHRDPFHHRTLAPVLSLRWVTHRQAYTQDPAD